MGYHALPSCQKQKEILGAGYQLDFEFWSIVQSKKENIFLQKYVLYGYMYKIKLFWVFCHNG